MKSIPIYFTFNREYILPAKVAIYSLLLNASNNYFYELYIVHNTLTDKDCNDIKSHLKNFNAQIKFIRINKYENIIKRLKNKSHFSEEIFYKLIAAEIFNQYDRIICTDVDVIFTGDISELINLYPNEDFFYAGVGPTDITGRLLKYKNNFSINEIEILKHEISAGILLINLKNIRKHNKQKEITDFYINNYNRLILPEQDCITLTCWPQIKYLPYRYMIISDYYKADISKINFYKGTPEFSKDRETSIRNFKEALHNPIQIHYAGPNKPWNSICCSKQYKWIITAYKAGCLMDFLFSFPLRFIKSLKRYSLKRFLKKTYTSIIYKFDI